MNVEGKTVIVTGASSGLGEATANHLASLGGHVVGMDLRPPGTGPGWGSEATFVEVDVANSASVAHALARATIGAPPLAAVVHCAGRGSTRQRILDRENQTAPPEDFMDVLGINVLGTFNVLSQSAARMAANEPVDGDRGVVVLTSSVAAFEGQVGQLAYAASKAAVHGMTIVAARELASRGIRVCTIAPGVFDTPMVARVRDDIRAQLAAAVPHPRRLGQPEEYARLAAAIIANGYLNGETIRLDGAIRMAPR